MEISLFKHLKKVDTPFHRPIEFAIERIKSGKSKEKVEQVRSLKSKSERDELKRKILPCYCFAGTFSSRSVGGLITPSGLITIDIDGLDDDSLYRYRDILINDPFTFVLFISPSGNGLKQLVKIPASKDEYKLFYASFIDYLNSIGISGIDKGTSDISRACFESYDPDIFVNNDSCTWDTITLPEIDEIGSINIDIPITSEYLIIERLMKWFNGKYTMNDGERNNNLFKLASAFNDFGVSKSVAEQTLIQFEAKDFKDSEIRTIIGSAYKRGSHSFGTKFFEDKERSDELDKAIRNGYSFDRIQSLFPEKSKREVTVMIEKKAESITVDTFWSIDKNGKISLVPHKFKYWLQSHGFFKHYPSSKDVFSFIYKKNNIIEDTNEKKIKDYVLEWLLKEENGGYMIYDFMAKSTRFFKEDFLSFLDTENIEFKRDSDKECNLFYSNCVVQITPEGASEIDYVDIDGFVWRKQLIPRKYESLNHSGCEFERFVRLISGDEDRFNTMRSILGYMMHSHVTSQNNRAIILNDELISDNPNGGSGKSLLASSLKYLKKYVSIDGKNFEFERSFAYQTVGLDTQVLVFNDVKKRFNFENLFSAITEGLTIEYKNQGAVTLPVEDSPKIMITTNYTIGGSGGSHTRRRFEIELSSYFGAYHSPVDEFGHMLFDAWDHLEWLKFDNFMISCVNYYLNNGLVKSEFKNLEARKFISETSNEFYEWTNDEPLPLRTRIVRSEYMEEFFSIYPEQRKWVSSKRFKNFIEIYAKYNGLKCISGRTNSTRWTELEPLDESNTVDSIEDITESDMPF